MKKNTRPNVCWPIFGWLLLSLSLGQAEILVSSNSTWRFFRGTNEASSPVTDWRTNTFDDSSWEIGPAPFFYGTNYTNSHFVGTPLSDMQSNYTCIFLRSTFVLTNISQYIGLTNRPWADDAYVTWINGVEVTRQGLGASGVFFPYNSNAPNVGTFFGPRPINAFTNTLRVGTNLMAVQVFNLSSNDVDFFANPELAAAVADLIPPVVQSVTPTPGTLVTNLAQIALVFSEAVTNVRVSDLRINGQPPTGLTSNGPATYTYTFPLLAPGNVLVTWNPAEAIKDLSGNIFTGTNTVWTFTNVVTAPYVVSAIPPFNSAVSNLTNVTVIFNTPVSGLLASDFFVGGYSPTAVTGSNTTYTFTLPALPNGVVQVTWDINQTIVDGTGLRMIEASNIWSYTIVDSVPPVVSSLTPAAGATVGGLTQVEILFSEPVSGVDAADLLINSQPATSVFGSGAGPYIFQFPQPGTGTVQFAWSAGHGIADKSSPPNAFAGGSWTVTLNPGLFLGDVIINEFAAANVVSNAPLDFTEFGVADDWIELYNRGTNAVRLLGWALTTDPALPGLWTFPDVTLSSGQYLVVYASGADRKVIGGTNRLHTNFKLNPNGNYLALFNAQSPRAVVSEFSPEYPEQRNDYSYGLNSSNQWRYYQIPTPGGPNGNSPITNIVAKPKVNVAHGMFEQPFTLIASCDTPGATLRFTTDGTAPLENTGTIYTGPTVVSNTTILRIAGYLTNTLPSSVATHSYIFINSILNQSNTPPGYPTVWQGCVGCTSDTASYPADYEMDKEIMTNAPNSTAIVPALKSLPVVSIALRPSDMFSTTNGIYANPEPAPANRYLWERACSVEFFLTNEDSGFQIDCGIRIQGNASRTPSKTEKHPMRLLFKGDYGAGSLDYPLFPDSPAQSYEGIVLRADFNNAWVHWDATQRPRGTRIRDAWGKATFTAMGQLAGHTRFVHLFIDGLYWGVYDLNERIDASFATRYLGGEKTDWDAIVSKPTEAVDGDMTAYNTMLANVKSKDMRALSNYTAALLYVDMTNLVDYMLLNFYAANGDWGQDGNWNALRRRTPGGLFQWYVWDAERYIENTGDNRVSNVDVASGLHTNLLNSPEYRRFFGDRTLKHLFNGGALTSNQMMGRWTALADVVSIGIVAESARWGDNRRDVMTTLGGGTAPFLLYDRYTNWLPEINRITTNYFPGRQASIISQLQTAGLFPTVTAPVFNQFGGRVSAGFPLTMTASNTIYYTTNGQDPRVYGTGTIAPLAQAYTAAVGLGQSMNVKARALFNGTNWSPLVEATFTVNSLIPPLRITEIMYNPSGGDVYEFLELQNTGTLPLNIGSYSFGGINFVFPFGTILNAGQRIVLGNNGNTNLFNARYPGVVVAGWYGGSLNNAGETITIFDATGRTVLSVSYDDEGGWPVAADGGGYSLEVIDPNGDPDDIANWHASGAQNGTPGQPNSTSAASTVVFNEVMAENLSAVNHEGTYPDWVELFNPTGGAISLANWSLSDDGNTRKFIFPGGTSITSGGYLVVWCDAATNTTSGLHSGFALGRNGETLSLYDANTNRIDALTYGLQIADYSVGRIGGAWTLTLPTTNAPNIAATLAPTTALSINEWLANAVPGGDDWIELFNTSNAPVALRNIYLGTSNALYQLRALSFLPPRGYQQFLADELPGADHLDFKLPAALGAIVLYDATGVELQRVTYGQQVQGVSQGRLPDGTATITSFSGSASPGTTNYVINYTGPALNELLARNASAVPGPWGNYPDYLEIYNPNPTNFNLGGMGLSDDAGKVKFVFAPGSTIASNGFLVVWCDGDRAIATNGTLNSGFSLSSSSGGAYLFNTAGQLVNSVEYGFQVQDLPIGISGGQWKLLSLATPGATNAATNALGSVSNLRVNEWMAAPSDGGDWFELYNLDPLPVKLSGLYLTDDFSVAGLSNTPIAALSFIGGKDWVKWIADEDPSQGRNHARFDLDRDADNIRIYAADFSIIDSVSFGAQLDNVSQGRLPDGGTNIVSFPATPTPDASNFLPLQNVVISEVLTHTDPPLEDAIEIQNTGSNSVNIGNWWISNSQRDFKKFRVAAGTTLASGQFQVFYENQFNANGSGTGTNFTLNSAHGDAVYLSEADAAGNLTGYRAGVEFGAAQNGVSFGRFVTSLGVDFPAMEQRTFGVDNPATTNEFRTGTGLPNSYPLVGPVIINEIMYHPVTGSNLTEFPNEEFVELYNTTTNPVPMFDTNNPVNAWKLSGGVDFVFSSNITISAHGYLLLVAFNPATNASALAGFRAKYGTNGTVLGPFQGQLNNDGEALELYKPDAPQQAPHPDVGFVPMILVDRVVYGDVAPWPTAADGGGASLQRINPTLYGNEPRNWKAEPATAGAVNTQSGLIPPTISGQPTNRTLILNGTASFAVTADGTGPLSYQWQHAGTNLPGATGTTLTVATAQAADAGIYRCVVTNIAGSIVSHDATLTVLLPPTISVPPSSQTVVAGTLVQFSVTAGGTAPLSYQWQRNGGNLSGQKSAQLTFNSAQPTDAGNYTVVITNIAGSITSVVAVLVVNVPPTITSDPTNVAVLANSPVTFNVAATGTAPLTYQWRKDGINIPGANGLSYTILSAQLSDQGMYSVLVTNVAGQATSLPAQLSVNTDSFLTQPILRADGVFTFTLIGQTNRNYTVQFTTDFSGWTNVTNLMLTNPQTPITDPGSTNATSRFYRARLEP